MTPAQNTAAYIQGFEDGKRIAKAEFERELRALAQPEQPSNQLDDINVVDIPKIDCVNHDCDKCKAQPEQEPVAYINIEERKLEWAYKYMSWDTPTVVNLPKLALYTIPPQRKPLTDEELKLEFEKLYPNDIGILELAENNKDFAVEAIGARHHWSAFKAGAKAIEAAHGIKEKNT